MPPIEPYIKSTMWVIVHREERQDEIHKCQTVMSPMKGSTGRIKGSVSSTSDALKERNI